LLIYAFVGFESATIMSGETRNPKETLPRALVFTPIAVGIFYFLIVIVFISVLPDPGAEGATLIDVGRELMGSPGVQLITLAAVFSIGGNLSSIMLAVPRLPFAMAEKRMLPHWFGHIHEKHATPSNSILMLGGLGLAFALSGSFVWLAIASSLTRLISYVLCIGALPFIRRKASEEERREAYKLKGGYTIPIIALLVCLFIGAQSDLRYTIPIIALLVCLFIGAQSDLRSWLVTGGLLIVGWVFYALAAQRRERWDKDNSTQS
jgi:amino acid transporter